MPAFVPALRLSEIPTAAGVAVEVAGHTLAVFRLGEGTYYAIDDECTHAGCPLSEGEVDQAANHVVCSCHEGTFDLASGQVKDGPPLDPIASYRTRIAGDQLEVELD